MTSRALRPSGLMEVSRPMTAPSKRMEKIIPDYEKPLYGNCMAMSIGLDVIMDKCPHFRSWINKLADLLTSRDLS